MWLRRLLYAVNTALGVAVEITWNAIIMYASMILETVIYVLLAALIYDLVSEIVIKNATTQYVIMAMVNV